ncbi:MAG: hypothetical protein WA584_07945 [Pyrinomonadaceae bacterium]
MLSNSYNLVRESVLKTFAKFCRYSPVISEAGAVTVKPAGRKTQNKNKDL